MKYGYDIALTIKKKFKDEEIWDKLPDIVNNINDYLPENISLEDLRSIGKQTFFEQYKINKDFLKLLSRINLTLDQAKITLNSNTIPHYSEYLSNIKNLNKGKYLENPYLLYEQTRLFEEKYRFEIGQIDIAMFPDFEVINDIYIDEYDDKRRIRAIIVSILESAAQKGHTLLTADKIIKEMKDFRSDINIELEITDLVIKAFEDYFTDEFISINVISSENTQIVAYQLNRISKIDKLILDEINKRLDGNIIINENWEDLLNKALSDSKEGENERDSRDEKLKAIKTLANSKLSVLTGGAGTGKTTTLVALCLSPQILENKIIILAPTGKARVVLETKLRDKEIPHKAYTVFQYLLKTDHCDPKTFSCYLSGKENNETAGATVIIDECSMLTEEMMGAIIEATKKAKRIIFVGDPNQLPPIGAGKPFFELVEFIKEKHPYHYTTLITTNRQKQNGEPRLDVEFVKMFTYDKNKETGEDIFKRITSDKENIEFRKFSNGDNLNDVILSALKDAAKMDSVDDIVGFDKSLGGRINGEWMNFGQSKEAVLFVDSWQILSPYRNDPESGSITINRLIHNNYRLKEYPNMPKKRQTRHPLGNDGIIYGEKVINLQNQDRSRYENGYPPEDCINFIANGEIGIVEKIWQRPSARKNTHEIRFTSQPEHRYNYLSRISENNSELELAYALTVHKAQGSGFGTTILIINEPLKGNNSFISREMIYTALTRQTDKVIILYNKDPIEFKKYADSSNSDLARRLTNLFDEKPKIQEYNNNYYSENLIHLTGSGILVRSKSEVIIINALNKAGLEFEYEKELKLQNGKIYLPDFTILTKSGKTIYWEHLGMLSNATYRENWEKKKADYKNNGISEENKNLIITDEPDGAINEKLFIEKAAEISKY